MITCKKRLLEETVEIYNYIYIPTGAYIPTETMVKQDAHTKSYTQLAAQATSWYIPPAT